jgi:general L-amino acid transport system permease protein
MWRRLQANLFSSAGSTLLTLLLFGLLSWGLIAALRWSLWDAVWHAGSLRTCRLAGNGACWAFIGAKARLMLLGRYPVALTWRPCVATMILLGGCLLSWHPRCWTRWLFVGWGVAIPLVLVLMGGGVCGLAPVETDRWGGLPITMMLALFSLFMALPLAVTLALARRSRLPVPRLLAIAVIEGVRGVPLVTILFGMALVVPLCLPTGVTIDKLFRLVLGFAIFLAAYFAEDIRAGLQAIPRGQAEAAEALGLSAPARLRYVILPQALLAVVPAMVGNAIGHLKNTSLVAVVGLFDLTLSTQNALLDPRWRGAGLEGYLFLGALYFAGCFALSRWGAFLESYWKGRA